MDWLSRRERKPNTDGIYRPTVIFDGEREDFPCQESLILLHVSRVSQCVLYGKRPKSPSSLITTVESRPGQFESRGLNSGTLLLAGERLPFDRGSTHQGTLTPNETQTTSLFLCDDVSPTLSLSYLFVRARRSAGGTQPIHPVPISFWTREEGLGDKTRSYELGI